MIAAALILRLCQKAVLIAECLLPIVIIRIDCDERTVYYMAGGQQSMCGSPGLYATFRNGKSFRKIIQILCVNDIICCGAKPLFFLDYIAIGKNIPEKVVSLVSGVSEGCVRAGCALIGGETAEHPGTMKPDDYDLAGFAVGVVDRGKILDKNKMQPGDVVIALPSSGLHSNGYSLVRKVFDVENADLGQYYGELGCALGEELLRPTKIYVRPVLAAIEAADIRGISHITGGGFYENIPRCIPDGLCAKIEKKALRIPPIFPLLSRMGGISERDMFNTFNMGTGMVLVAAKDSADKALAALHSLGQEAGVIGEIVLGEEKVELC